MSTTYLTVAEVAAQMAVGSEQVLGWIHAGQLSASNVAAVGRKRPRWRIAPDDLESFLAARRNRKPVPTQRRKRKKESDVIEFF